jgi:hypothetical protein
MIRTPVTSGQILSIGHDPATNKLHVEFRGGSVYEYDDVPATLHQQLLGFDDEGNHVEGHSIGGSFGTLIKKAEKPFVYRKLPKEGEDK